MTSKWTIVVGVVCACLSVARAQSSNGHQRSAESALLGLENRWVAALVKGDIATLDSILVDSYVDTDEEAHRTNKQGVLAAFKSRDLNMKSIKLSDMHVFLYSDFAVVTGTAEQVGAYQGHALTPKIVFTDSFVLQNGKWRVVASQRTTARAE